MNIAIHISSSFHHHPIALNSYFACRLAEERSEDHFHFIYDNKKDVIEKTPANVTNHILGPVIKNRWLLWCWVNFRLKRKLQQAEVRLLISSGWIPSSDKKILELVLDWNPSLLKKKFKFIKNRFSYSHKNRIQVGRNIVSGKMKSSSCLIPAASNNNQKVEEAAKINFREKHTDGFDYYLYISSTEDQKDVRVSVLKAFTRLKKWQQSSMKLMIMEENGHYPDFPELEQYKYREEVLLMSSEDPEKRRLMMASAFAGISLHCASLFDPAIELMELSVPVIMADTSENKSLFGDAVLYTALQDTDIARSMIEAYKNETARDRLIRRGLQLSGEISWEHLTSRIGETIDRL
jgi:glycosyltransferase involved in cell wall biosynthesis